MDYAFRDGRLDVNRALDEKARIAEWLKKIEGQVRGVWKFVEEGRYCLDEVQRAIAIVAAMRQVELLIMADCIDTVMECAVRSRDVEEAVKDMMAALRLFEMNDYLWSGRAGRTAERGSARIG